MFAKKVIYQILSILLLFGFGIAFFLSYNKNNIAKDFLTRAKNANKLGFDSLQNSIDRENSIYFQLQKSINDSDFNIADALIDTLKKQNKSEIAHVYAGMVYEKQKKYSKAIDEYNSAINNDPYSIGLKKRAELYLRMNKLDSSLEDYKKIYNTNYDFSLSIAKVFEIKKMKDSALKYYIIYSEHYPQDESVIRKIDSLKSL